MAMAVAIILGIGLLVGIGALSLLSGALNFLFVRPKIEILKSKFGASGFAFSFVWDQNAEPFKFDRLKIQVFNPFGTPTQMEITREFEGSGNDFARDLDLGAKFIDLISIKGLDSATVEIEVASSNDSITHHISMKGNTFLSKYKSAILTVDEANNKFSAPAEKARFEIPERTFISPPLPKTGKALKIATNPEFAAQFAGVGTSGDTGGSVAVANTAGWFTANTSTFTTGQIITVSGTLTGNATITGYVDPTTYYVVDTNGTTTFQLAASEGAANIVTAAGNTRGLTFSEAVSTTAKSGADPVTWTNGTGDLTLAQVQNYTS